MCLFVFSKVNLSSLVTARSSTESLGFIVMLLIDEGAELFCKFLFVIIISDISWDCDLILAN